MKKNIYDVERVVRFVAGAILTSLAFVGPANPWFLLGIVPMLTGLVGTCPLYSALGMSTRKGDSTSSVEHHGYLHKVQESMADDFKFISGASLIGGFFWAAGALALFNLILAIKLKPIVGIVTEYSA